MRSEASTCTFGLLGALACAGCGDNRSHPPEHDAYDPAPPVPLECLPDLDGRIVAAELGAALGVPARYLVSPAGEEREVDLEGAVDDRGQRTWDWSLEIAGDQEAEISASPLTGAWYADSFPGGEFAAPIDVAGRIHGVYVHDDAALSLLGLASAVAEPDEGTTLLVYQEPVVLYRFPIEPGAKWISTGEIQDGVLRGLPYAGKDIYDAEVLGTGALALPPVTFEQAHLVLLRAVVEPAVGKSVTTLRASFLFECFGEVARATSRPDETEESFTTAAEVRRLGL